MITHRQIRDAIVATIEAVPGCGLVHGHERYAKRHDDLRRLYVVNDEVRGWFITLRGRRERLASDGQLTAVTHEWRIRHFRSFEDADASELQFDDVIEAVCAAFHADGNPLKALVQSIDIDGEAGAQLIDAGPVMFAGVLCHAATLGLKTLTYIDRLDAEAGAISDVFAGRAPKIGADHEPDYVEVS